MSADSPFTAPKDVLTPSLSEEMLRRAWPAAPAGVTGALVFGLFLSLLFVLQLGSMGPACAMLAALVIAVINRRAVPDLFSARAYLFLIPALALASAVWSEDPFNSFRSGLELGATVAAGMVLALVDRRKEVLIGAAAAFAAYTLVSLVMGHTTGAGSEEAAFTGLNDGKNYLAEIASTGVLLSAALFAMAVGEARKPIWMLIAAATVVAALLEIYVLTLARSAGALIALGVGLAALAGLTVVSRMNTTWRATAVGVVAIVAAALGLFHNTVVRVISDVALRAFDKDPTLTGRTYLWYRARQMIAEKPMLGHGYAAFWRQGNPDAEGLWAFGNITARTGFNFHNTGIELLMQFGWCGAFIVAGLFFLGAGLLVRRFIVRPEAMLCGWLALVAFELIRTFYESIGPSPFYFSNVLLVTAFAAAFPAPVLIGSSKT